MGGESGCEVTVPLSSLSELIFETAYSVGQEIFAFVRKTEGNFRNLWLRQ